MVVAVLLQIPVLVRVLPVRFRTIGKMLPIVLPIKFVTVEMAALLANAAVPVAVAARDQQNIVKVQSLVLLVREEPIVQVVMVAPVAREMF